jgi:hypothetical protein
VRQQRAAAGSSRCCSGPQCDSNAPHSLGCQCKLWFKHACTAVKS